MQAIAVVINAISAALSLVVLYLLFLAVVHLLARSREVKFSPPEKRFAVIIPAHDEEQAIRESIRSIRDSDYPQSLYEIHVVADNCTDRTREAAEAAGARCLVRNDPLRPGKGYALRYAFDTLANQGYDAFVVIDADTVASPNLLSAFNNRLILGQKVIQCRYLFDNADTNSLSYLLHVGKCIENSLLWESKCRLGFPVILQGNGMCIASEVLDSHPWEAFSITEDTEYSFFLIRNSVRIYFAHETEVSSPPAALYSQTSKQRARWASGNFELSRKHVPRMILDGLKSGRIECVDAAFTPILNSKLTLLMVSTATLAASVFLHFIKAAKVPPTTLIWSGSVFGLVIFYFAVGVAISKFSLRRARLLLLSPVSLLYLSLVSSLALLKRKHKIWVRTPRGSNESTL